MIGKIKFKFKIVLVLCLTFLSSFRIDFNEELTKAGWVCVQMDFKFEELRFVRVEKLLKNKFGMKFFLVAN